ncbi:MAG: 3'-5' exonuclease [Candidatus Pelethousia sp.]|nr:3'-5' exonuclease [Candidatus Pelethousia sp.]
MHHIVFDMEWNQAVIKEKIIQSPVFLHGEIVQIGAIKLNENFCLVDEFKLDIRPAYYTRMNSRVRRLTGISNQMLKQGLPFPVALEQFKAWCGVEGPFSFITWGTDDMPILRENLQLYELDLNWLPFCYDLQRIYDAQIAKGNRQWSLSTALEKLELSPIGQAHDALNDARNTAQVCGALNMHQGIAEYAAPVRHEKRRHREQQQIYPGYTARSEAFEDSKARRFYCPACGRRLRFGNWSARGGGRFVTTAVCAQHGEYFAKLRIKQVPDGTFTLIRTLRTMDEEARSQLEKQSSHRKHRCRSKPYPASAQAEQTLKKPL